MIEGLYIKKRNWKWMIQEHPPGIFLFLWKVLEFLSYHIFQRMALIMLAHKCPFVALKGWSLNNVIIHTVVTNGAAICQPTAQSSIRTMEEDMIFRFIILFAKAASGRRNLMPRASFFGTYPVYWGRSGQFPREELDSLWTRKSPQLFEEILHGWSCSQGNVWY